VPRKWRPSADTTVRRSVRGDCVGDAGCDRHEGRKNEGEAAT
jgi:hypothetical protein